MAKEPIAFLVFAAVVDDVCVFDLILVGALIFGQSTLLPRQLDYAKNLELPAKYYSIPETTYIIVPYLGIASQLNFYAHRTTYMAQGYLKEEESGFGQRQFEFWGFPEISKGADIIYYGKADKIGDLKKQFARVEIWPALKIYLLESYLDELIPYYCQGFSGKVRL